MLICIVHAISGLLNAVLVAAADLVAASAADPFTPLMSRLYSTPPAAIQMLRLFLALVIRWLLHCYFTIGLCVSLYNSHSLVLNSDMIEEYYMLHWYRVVHGPLFLGLIRPDPTRPPIHMYYVSWVQNSSCQQGTICMQLLQDFDGKK